jgi:ATP synthase protein I
VIGHIGPYVGAIYTLTGGILGLGLLGYGLDRWLGTSPWLLLSGLLIGMVVGFYELYKVMLGGPQSGPGK